MCQNWDLNSPKQETQSFNYKTTTSTFHSKDTEHNKMSFSIRASSLSVFGFQIITGFINNAQPMHDSMNIFLLGIGHLFIFDKSMATMSVNISPLEDNVQSQVKGCTQKLRGMQCFSIGT